MHSTSAIREVSASICAASKKRRVGTRFPNINQDAKELGVSRPYLWLVLTGKREGTSLLSRYARLLKSSHRPIPTDLGKAA